jgi:hypothetical protein
MTEVKPNMEIDRFYDARGFRLNVGTRVRYADGDSMNDWGTVVGFGDWDLNDQDDHVAFVVSPDVLVKFDRDQATWSFETRVEYVPQDPFDRFWELAVDEIAVWR